MGSHKVALCALLILSFLSMLSIESAFTSELSTTKTPVINEKIDGNPTPIMLNVNQLNAKHLHIIWPGWNGNKVKGLVAPLKGGLIIDYLSQRFKFTYEMVQVENNYLETNSKGVGQLNYLMENKLDLVFNVIVPTADRLQKVDLSVYWFYDAYYLLTPAPQTGINTDAVVKPFQWPIWVSLAISIIIVTFILKNIDTLHQVILSRRNRSSPSSEGTYAIERSRKDPFIYVFGVLLSQGRSCQSNRLLFRLVAAGWVLAAFVIVQAYTSTLITYILAPITTPLADSIYDVVYSDHNINLFIRRAGNLETLIFSNKTSDGPPLQSKIMRKITERQSVSYGCKSLLECVEFVGPRSRNVFVEGRTFLIDGVIQHFKKTGECEFRIGKQSFWPTGLVLALQKNGPYTSTLNKGLLELLEIGLFDFWDLWFRTIPAKCRPIFKTESKSKHSEKLSPLTLKNLTGAFIVLLVGISLSVLCFLCEKIVQCHQKHSIKIKRNK